MTTGIGLALARDLTSKNWKVVIADINPESGATVAAELGTNARFHCTDVSSWSDQAALFKYASTTFGRLDFFAANAGIDDKKSIYDEIDEDDEPKKPFLKVLDVNLVGVIWGVKLAAWYMRRNKDPAKKGGSIVLTSSAAGLYPMATNPLYAATKAGVGDLFMCRFWCKN